MLMGTLFSTVTPAWAAAGNAAPSAARPVVSARRRRVRVGFMMEFLGQRVMATGTVSVRREPSGAVTVTATLAAPVFRRRTAAALSFRTTVRRPALPSAAVAPATLAPAAVRRTTLAEHGPVQVTVTFSPPLRSAARDARAGALAVAVPAVPAAGGGPEAPLPGGGAAGRRARPRAAAGARAARAAGAAGAVAAAGAAA